MTSLGFSLLLLAAGAGDSYEDTRGPVQVAGLHPKVSRDGVEAPSFRWSPFSTDPDRWSALWVTAPRAVKGMTSTGSLLRGEAVLPAQPLRAEARIACSAPYLLYINGTPVSRGPADQGKDYADRGFQRTPFYDLRDLTPFFRSGTNTMAVLTVPGARFLLESQCSLPGGGSKVVGTDGTWRGTPASFLTVSSGISYGSSGSKRFQTFDAGKEPVGWSGPHFDDSSWTKVGAGTLSPASTSDAPVAVRKGELRASELPPCMETLYPVKEVVAVPGGHLDVPAGALTGGKPLEITGDGSVDVIFDRVMSARIGFRIRGGAGAQILFTPSELQGRGKVPAGLLLPREGIQTFETRGFHAVGAVRLEFRNVTKPFEILEVTADWTSQPLSYEGSFECSDPFLNRLWKACRTSVQINFQTHHLDSPTHQEPISDYGDYLIEDLVAYNAFGYGNLTLIRQDLRKWAAIMRDADFRTFHTSYALMWLQALMNYYDRTGDASLVKELAPTVHDLLAQFATYVGPEGLVSQAPDYMFMDWVTLGGLPAHHPPAEIGMGYMTALYYRALADGIRVAEIAGTPEKSSTYRNLRTRILGGYNSLLWDSAAGLYRDGVSHLSKVPPHKWMPADQGTIIHSAQNNAMAVAYGLADDKKPGELMERTLAIRPWNLQPYFMHFVFDAMDRSGVYEKEANTWLRKWTINDRTQSLLEANGMGDLSHGWTSTPLYQMSARILGVEPASPGFDRILVKPRLGDLQWAKGIVPTPHGPVSVSWAAEKDGLRFDVTLPEGASGVLSLPTNGTNAALDLDGKSVSGTLNGGRLDVSIGPGHHVGTTSP